MQRQVLAEESVCMAQENQSLFMQVVADARVHQLRHLQQLEELHISPTAKVDLGVILERLLALVVFGVGVLHLL